MLSDRDRATGARGAVAEGVEPFTQARLDTLREGGRMVFVDMTAAWCTTCQVNERTVLDREGVQAVLKAGNVAYLKGDWNNQNPEITGRLEQYGRSGMPPYLICRDGGEVRVLSQMPTEAIVLDAIAPSGS